MRSSRLSLRPLRHGEHSSACATTTPKPRAPSRQAERLFAERGFSKVTIREMGRRREGQRRQLIVQFSLGGVRAAIVKRGGWSLRPRLSRISHPGPRSPVPIPNPASRVQSRVRPGLQVHPQDVRSRPPAARRTATPISQRDARESRKAAISSPLRTSRISPASTGWFHVLPSIAGMRASCVNLSEAAATSASSPSSETTSSRS